MSLACWILGHRWRYQACERCGQWRNLPTKQKDRPVARHVHVLKLWPQYAPAVAHGDKCFEVRKNDRDFKVGDLVIYRVFDPMTQQYAALRIHATITYVLPGGQHGIAEGYVVYGHRITGITQDHSDFAQPPAA